jgi:hypothetical protein
LVGATQFGAATAAKALALWSLTTKTPPHADAVVRSQTGTREQGQSRTHTKLRGVHEEGLRRAGRRTCIIASVCSLSPPLSLL